MSSAAVSPIARRQRLWAFAGLVIYVVVATLPGVYLPLQPGLDPSWVIAVNRLPHSEFVYGRDFISPYGPFGFLLVTQDIGPNIAWAIAVWALVQGALAAVLCHFRRTYGEWCVWGFGLALAAGVATGLWAEYHLALLVGLCALAALDETRYDPIFAGIAGATAGVMVFIKFSAAVCGVTALAVFSVLAWRHRTRVAVCWAAFLCVVIPVMWVFFPTTAGFFSWFVKWWRIGAELSVAMSLAGSAWTVVLALLAAACLALGLAGWRKAWLFAPMLVLAFRHAFSRQDGHVTAFFGLAAAVAALAFLCPGRARRLRAMAGALVIGISLVCGLIYPSIPPLTFAGYARNAFGVSGIRKLSTLLYLNETRADLKRRSESALRVNRLPDAWRAGLHDATVDSLPWDLSIVPANGLRWRPNPTLQLFGAYTSELDQWCAAHFAAPEAPDFLAVSYGAVDGRAMWFETPATWLAVLSHYRLEANDDSAQRLLLRRAGPSRWTSPRLLGRVDSRIGDAITVPAGAGVVTARIHLRLSTLGHLAKAVWRVAPLWIDVQTNSGRILHFRLVPGTVSNGIPLAPLVTDYATLRSAFAGGGTEHAVVFRLRQTEPAHFVRRVQIEFVESATIKK